MLLTRIDVRGLREGDLESALPRPSAGPGTPGEDAGLAETVARIISRVRAGGDRALIELTREFDGVHEPALTVPAEDLERSVERVPEPLLESLEVAWGRIVAYHRHQAGAAPSPFEDGIVRIDELVRPVRSAGLYAPGGRAIYPSSVLMCAAPAVVAGVEELVLCVPPARDGRAPALVLAAARIAGIRTIHPIGGAQAIAAMAFGTETVRRVDVVVGPGNRYVAEAKRQVSGNVGVAAGFAGPSEVVVVADGTSRTELAAVDLVVQAEHGPDGLAFLVTWVPSVIDTVEALVEEMVERSPRGDVLKETLTNGGYAVLVDGNRQAGEVSNFIAPEHLELQIAEPDEFVCSIRQAGAVFVGPWAPASLGDYVAGTNHVLPTARTARFASALRVDDFRTHTEVVSVGRAGLDRLGPHVVELATAEGLPAHSESVLLRSERGAARREAVDADLDYPPYASRPLSESTSTAMPSVRDDLTVMSGYHSPQVDVKVRINTNESPFAPPAEWLEEVLAEIRRIEFNRYPDRDAKQLRKAIAAFEGVDPEHVFCANGSNEVLQSLLLAYGGRERCAAVFEPTYALHRHIAMLSATRVFTGWREPDHSLDPAVAEAVVARCSPVITFLCSPNNPTGRAEPDELISHVLAVAPGLLVVDEAYGQFSERSALDVVRAGFAGSEKLVVTRTFSKTWSMAACRLGYMVAHPSVVAACEGVTLPYHLDAMTQAAGMVALRYEAEMDDRISVVVRERERVQSALREMEGVDYWPSQANFVLFRPSLADAKEVWSKLLDRQVLVRDCSGWPGLTGCLRATIGTPDENTAFLEALGESLGTSATIRRGR